ncbi:putative PAZ domain superfamily protein [Helianthus anomalus]
MDLPITGITTTLLLLIFEVNVSQSVLEGLGKEEEEDHSLLELDMDSLPRNKHELTIVLEDATSNRYIANRTLKNLRVKASPTNTEYKITGLSEKPCNEQLCIFL